MDFSNEQKYLQLLKDVYLAYLRFDNALNSETRDMVEINIAYTRLDSKMSAIFDEIGNEFVTNRKEQYMAKYRKKPIVVEAIQWNVPDKNRKVKLAKDCKDHPEVRPTSYKEVYRLCGTAGYSPEPPYWDWSVMGVIDTLEGKHIVRPGDYIIKGVKGEFYPCKPDIFKMTYDLVEIKEG